MNILPPGTLSIVLVLSLAMPGVAQKPAAEPRPAAGTTKVAERPKQDMKRLNRAARAIGKFLKSPDGAAPPMDQVATLQQVAMAAKFKLPPRIGKQPKAEQAAALKSYRKEMNSLIRHSLDLEEALEAKDWAKAGAVLGAMSQLKKSGHRKFKGKSKW